MVIPSFKSHSCKKTYSSPKSFNNHFGVPISLSNLSVGDKYGIFEVGMSKAGEIRDLSKLIQPHIGVITNIGNSHLANLKNINGVFKVKSEIVNNIKKDGCLVIPSENGKHESQWKKMRNDISIITFGLDKDADFRASNIKYKTNSSAFTILSDKYCVEQKVNINLAGEHNIKNILAAYAVLSFLNKPEKSIVKNISNVKLTGRQNQSNWINRSTLIDDTYNANPDSVKKSVDLLSHSKKRKILVLGDMLELGRMRKQMHKDIGKYALKQKIDIFVGFGDLAKYAVDEFGKNGIFFNNEGELKIFLKKNVSKGDIVLIKGSRGMQMEKFINV